MAAGARGETTGVAVVGAGRVDVLHSVLEGFDSGLVLVGNETDPTGLRIANNLVLGSRRGLRLSRRPAADLLAGNAFAHPSGDVEVRLGDSAGSLSELRRGPLAGNEVAGALGLENADLARIPGARLVDAGVPIEGFAFEGAAPDVGIAER